MDFTPRHPTLQDAERLIRRLSTFWSLIFDNQQQLVDMYFGRSQAAAQEFLDFVEAYSCAVFKDIPVFHREMWAAITISEKGLARSPLRYGEGAAYGGGAVYGVTSSNALYWVLGDNIKDISFLHDNVISPRVTYARGVDFHIEDGVLYFCTNPFDDDRLSFTTLYDAGEAVDRGLVLWGQCVDIDRNYLISHIGAALKLYLPSSEAAKRAMVALAELYTRFPNVANLNAFMAAIVDVPVAMEDGEVVERVLHAPEACVVTDKHVYSVPAAAGVVVIPGDVLRAGDMLTDAVKLVELAYETPTYEDFPAVAAGKSLLVGDYSRDLIFPNVMTDSWYENGNYRFQVSGNQDDVARFWEGVDARGGLGDLGDRINPAEVIFDCLRGNGIAVRLNASSFGPYGSPQLLMEFLRRILSPALAVLSFIEVFTVNEDEAGIASENTVSIMYISSLSDHAGVAASNSLALAYTAHC